MENNEDIVMHFFFSLSNLLHKIVIASFHNVW